MKHFGESAQIQEMSGHQMRVALTRALRVRWLTGPARFVTFAEILLLLCTLLPGLQLSESYASVDRPSPKIRLPEGTRAYAIGDVHGNDALLGNLLEQVYKHAALDGCRAPGSNRTASLTCHLVFLGDYVDRGPGSKRVLEMVMQELAFASRLGETNSSRDSMFATHALKGNHEENFLDFLAQKSNPRHFLGYNMGGLATVRSYGVDVDNAVSFEEIRNWSWDAIPTGGPRACFGAPL